MNDSKTSGRTPKSWLRIVAGGVVLGLIGVVAGRLILPDEPALLRDLPTGVEARDRAFAERIAQQYPPGTPEAMLREQLAEQGFRVQSDARRAGWEHVAFPCKDFAQVEWDAAAGRVTAMRAVLWQACT